MTKSTTRAMRRVAAAFAAAVSIAWTCFGDDVVRNVWGKQREETKLVDTYYDLTSTDGGPYWVDVEFIGRTKDVTAVTFRGDVGLVEPGRDRHIVWNAGQDWDDQKDFVTVKITAEKSGQHGSVQLWKGGPYWATENIGAKEPWERGWYFQWGGTIPYTVRGSRFVSMGGESPRANWTPYGKSTATLYKMRWIDGNNLPKTSINTIYDAVPGNLTLIHDAARCRWGENWRMPTFIDYIGLITNCEWTVTTTNGVNGYTVRGKGAYASKSIFLPAAGGSLVEYVDYEDPYFHADPGFECKYYGVGGFYWTSSAVIGEIQYIIGGSGRKLFTACWAIDLTFVAREDGKRNYFEFQSSRLDLRNIRPVRDLPEEWTR